MRKSDLAKVVNQIDALGSGDDADADPRSTAARHASDMADLLSESSGLSRQDTLNWLLHSARGNTLFLRSLGKRLERMKTKTKEKAAMPEQTREEFMTSVAKQHGATAIAKHILDVGPGTRITEYELTKALTAAVEPAQGQSRAQALAKLLESDQTVREAYAVIAANKQMSYLQGEPLTKVGGPTAPMAITAPVFTGGEEGNRSRSSTDRDPDPHSIGNVGDSAYDQLVALCNAELKRRGLSSAHFARIFATIYEDPSNAALAQQERRENRPGGVARMAT